MGERISNRLNLHTLGGFKIEHERQVLTRLGSRKVEGLFVYLAVTERTHPRELLSELLWNDRTQKQAMSNLRRILTGLRQHFGPYVTITRETVGIKANSDLWVDVKELKAGLALLGDISGATSAAAINDVETALTLYQGDFLAGFHVREASGFESWLINERQYWQQLVLTGLTSISAYYEAASLYSQGINTAKRILAIDSLQESAHRRLMQLLTLNGRRSEAITQYETCRRLLMDELGVLPSPETESLYKKIIKGQLVSDLSDSKIIISTHPDPLEESDIQENTAVFHNLPLSGMPFVGRQNELLAFKNLLTDSNIRLITITGVGGIGKTRFALAAAEQELRSITNYPDGIYFVDLSPLNEVEKIPTALAEALDFSFQIESDQTKIQQLVNFLRQKQTLLLLDNFEHLLDGAAFVDDIIKSAPKVKILVTSRERLQLQLEQNYPLDGLKVPIGLFSNREEIVDIEVYSAVKLFLQIARRNQPHITFDNQKKQKNIVRICQMVDGMPLALELAASWVGSVSLAEIIDELQQGLDILETELRDVPSRHRSIRATIDYSWHNMSEREQEIFRNVSVFHAGFTRHAAQAVAGANLHLLNRLVRNSFLKFETVHGRYQIHELLRQFGKEKLITSGKLVAAEKAHQNYFLDFMIEREADIKGRRQLPALQEIKNDFENIRVAWLKALEQKAYEEMDKALDCLILYHIANGLIGNDIAKLRQQTMSLISNQSDGKLPRIWYRVAARDIGLHKRDIPLFERALTFAQQNNDHKEIAYVTSMLGWAWTIVKEYDKGLHLLEDGAKLSRKYGSIYYEIFLDSLAAIYIELGNKEKAYQLLQQCLTEFQALNDSVFSIRPLYTLAWVSWQMGDFNALERYSLERERLLNQMGKRSSLSILRDEVQHLFLPLIKGEFEELTIRAHRAIAAQKERGVYQHNQAITPILLANLAGNYILAGQLIQSFPEENSLFLKPEYKFQISWCQAIAYTGMGDYLKAGEAFHQTLTLTIDRQDVGSLMLSLPIGALLLAITGNSIKAAEILALTFKRMAGWTGWLEKWDLFNQLRSDLEAECGATIFAEAWQRGQTLELWSTARFLLSEIE